MFFCVFILSILVGAPKDSSQFNGVVENASGAIYKCPINLNRFTDCEQISVDFKSRKSDEGYFKELLNILRLLYYLIDYPHDI